jgi:hypothetical protein
MHNNRNFWFWGAKRRFWFLFPVFFIAAFFAVGFVVMWLWNWILPDLIGVKTLDLPRALGLLALCRILFGGFGGSRHSNRRKHFREEMREKWHSMTEEERTQFKARWGEKFPKRDN